MILVPLFDLKFLKERLGLAEVGDLRDRLDLSLLPGLLQTLSDPLRDLLDCPVLAGVSDQDHRRFSLTG
jgi:hypothetical protein